MHLSNNQKDKSNFFTGFGILAPHNPYTSTGHLENGPKIVKVFDHEFPAAFQPRERREKVLSGTKARMYYGLISVCLQAEAGCVSLSRPDYGQ
jgi:hypothetical protein